MPNIKVQRWIVFEANPNTPFSIAAALALHCRNSGASLMLFNYDYDFFYVSVATTLTELYKKYAALTQRLGFVEALDEYDVTCSCCRTFYEHTDGIIAIDKSLGDGPNDAANLIFICEECFNRYNDKPLREYFDEGCWSWKGSITLKGPATEEAYDKLLQILKNKHEEEIL